MSNPLTLLMPPHTTLNGHPIHPGDWTLRAFHRSHHHNRPNTTVFYLTHNTNGDVHRVTATRTEKPNPGRPHKTIELHLRRTP